MLLLVVPPRMERNHCRSFLLYTGHALKLLLSDGTMSLSAFCEDICPSKYSWKNRPVDRHQLIGALGKEQAESILPPDVPFEASISEDPSSAETAPSSPASAWLPFSTTKPTNRAAAPLPAFQEVNSSH